MVAALAACEERSSGPGGADGPPATQGTGPSGGKFVGGQTSDPGDAASLDPDACSGDSWPSPDSERRTANCERQPYGGFRCDCGDGALALESSQENCWDALQQACEIDRRAPDFCESPSFGVCWPEPNGGGHLCRCEGLAEPQQANGASCHEALYGTCLSLCSDETGYCGRPSGATGSGALGYACACGPFDSVDPLVLSSAVPTLAPGRSCESVLSSACGGACEAVSGSCRFDGGGYECSCEDDTAMRIEGALSSPRSCDESLHRACGLPTVVDDGACESALTGVIGRCSARPPIVRLGETPPERFDYVCTCQQDQQLSETVHTANACGAALRAACPRAFRPPQGGSPLALGDYGAVCARDADCSGGACYVPGTGIDPICSKQCDSDAACPDGTLCTFGHCMIRCEAGDDAGCLTLNDAVSNPLYCMPRSRLTESQEAETDAGHVCIQTSEP